MNPERQAALTEEWLRKLLGDTRVPREFTAAAVARITTEGARQYYDASSDRMRFETMTVAELAEYAREEALDLANYAFMLQNRAEGNWWYAEVARKTVVAACALYEVLQ